MLAGLEASIYALRNVYYDPATDPLTDNGEFTASVVVVRCLTTTAGSLRWQIRFDVGLWTDIAVAVRIFVGARA
jgi:hypothetical protein